MVKTFGCQKRGTQPHGSVAMMRGDQLRLGRREGGRTVIVFLYLVTLSSIEFATLEKNLRRIST